MAAMADEAQAEKQLRDYSAEVNEKLPQLSEMAKLGVRVRLSSLRCDVTRPIAQEQQWNEALEAILALEKKTRLVRGAATCACDPPLPRSIVNLTSVRA